MPSNVVEGQSRNTTKDYLSFLYISRASLEEYRYFILLSRDLVYIDEAVYENLEKDAGSVSRMLNKLINSLKAHL